MVGEAAHSGFSPASALTQAKFELITSEASYIHSLSVAVGHFLGSAELSECLGTQDKQWLFSKLPALGWVIPEGQPVKLYPGEHTPHSRER